MTEEMEKLQESQDVMISGIAQSMVVYGVSPSVGRIYGVLYFSEEPLTLDQIKEQVAMSKASVSNGIRELIETEMVTKVWKKGERKDHFMAEKDFMKNFLNYFVKVIRLERGLITKAMEQAEPAIEKIAENTTEKSAKETADRDLALISEAKDYLDWLMRIANHFESREIFKEIPRKQ